MDQYVSYMNVLSITYEPENAIFHLHYLKFISNVTRARLQTIPNIPSINYYIQYSLFSNSIS